VPNSHPPTLKISFNLVQLPSLVFPSHVESHISSIVVPLFPIHDKVSFHDLAQSPINDTTTSTTNENSGTVHLNSTTSTTASQNSPQNLLVRSENDRNKNNEVGPEENYKPQVWRVYKRKRGKGMKDDELAKRVMRST